MTRSWPPCAGTSGSRPTRPPGRRALPAASRWSTPSAWPPATTRRCSRSTTSSTTSRARTPRWTSCRRCSAGEKPPPTRGAPLTDFRNIELQIAGVYDDRGRGGRPVGDRPDAARLDPRRRAALAGAGHARRHPRPATDTREEVGDHDHSATTGERKAGPGAALAGADPPLGVPPLLDDRHLRVAGRLPGTAQRAAGPAGPAHRADEGVRPARPRRRGLPDRAEVVVPAARSTASRTTSWSTPTRANPAPARTSR